MTTPESTRFQGLVAFRARIRALPGGTTAWRVGVTLLGGLIIVAGIILLPLPGPGWLVIFLGLGIWATEYTWAARLLSWARGMVLQWTRWIKAQPRWVQALVALAGLLLLAGLALAGWYLL